MPWLKILAFHLGRGGNKDAGRRQSGASRRGAARQKREKEKAAAVAVVVAPSCSGGREDLKSAHSEARLSKARCDVGLPPECAPVPQGSGSRISLDPASPLLPHSVRGFYVCSTLPPAVSTGTATSVRLYVLAVVNQ